MSGEVMYQELEMKQVSFVYQFQSMKILQALDPIDIPSIPDMLQEEVLETIAEEAIVVIDIPGMVIVEVDPMFMSGSLLWLDKSFRRRVYQLS